MKKAWLKYLYTGITTAALTGGAAILVYRYQSGSHFVPRGQAPALQENQVVFDDEKAGENPEDETELPETDAETENQQETAENENAARLFRDLPEKIAKDAETVEIPDQTTLSESDEASKREESQTSVVYELSGSGDKSAASVEAVDRDIRGTSSEDNAGGTNYAGAGNGNGSSDSNGNSGSGGSGNAGSNGNAGTGSENQDQAQNNGSADNTGTVEIPDSNAEPEPTPAPKHEKAKTVKDPKPAGKASREINEFNEPIRSYSEEEITEEEEDSLRALLYFADETTYPERFYKGQSITREMLYNAMTTEVVQKESSVSYAWGEGDLDRYVRIDAVSFDGGSSWEKGFPLTIPQDTAEEMLVRLSYRFRESEEWIQYRNEDGDDDALSYELAEGRVFVLAKALAADAFSVPENSILNTYDEYPTVGETLSLCTMNCLGSMLAENGGLDGISDTEALNDTGFDWYTGVKQTKLLSGWLEDGEPIGFDYTVTKGRHILEPGELTEIDPKLEVRLKLYRLSRGEDDSWQEDVDSDDMYFMQTLCGFADDGSASGFSRARRHPEWEMHGFKEALTVPEGIQIVDFDDTDDEQEKLHAAFIRIPASVRYIDTESTGLRVELGYVVDAENPYYSTEDGVLYNKEKTVLLAVPYETEFLTIPKTVEKVQLSSENRLKEIYLEAESLEDLPTISMDHLQGCRIVLSSKLLNDFVQKYWTMLEENGNILCIVGDRKNDYHLIDGLLIRHVIGADIIDPASGSNIARTDDASNIIPTEEPPEEEETEPLSRSTDSDISIGRKRKA